MNNQIRRQLLERHRASGFPGSIMDVFSAYNQGIDLIADFQQQQQQQVRQQQLQQLQQAEQAEQAQQQEQQVAIAETPEEQAEGLRPYHEAGNTNQTMVFPNIPANTPFNTVGMKAPINIEKYNNQGHLVESFKNVPPGIQSLPTGSQEGIVIETPANMQTGGQRSPIYTDNPKDSRLQAYNDSLSLYNSHTPTNRLAAQLEEIKTNPNFRYYRSLTNSELNSFPGKIKPIGGTHFDIPKLISDSTSGKNTTYSYYRVFDESGKEIPNEIGVSLSYKEPVQPVIYRELSRLTPKEATQIQVDANKSLQESNREEVRTRPSQTIFRQDPSVSKGQYPVGERVWDTSTRSWKTDMWDAEMQKDSRELAVPRQERWRTIDVPKGGFQTGGKKPNTTVTRDSPNQIADYMSQRFGGDPRTYLALSDTVAFHESAHTMDPKITQMEGGPGVGAFQIEPKSYSTFINRAERYFDSQKMPRPAWLNTTHPSQLNMDQQRALFLINMTEDPNTNMRAYGAGKASTYSQWMAGWKKKASETPGQDRRSFNESRELAKRQGIPGASSKMYVAPNPMDNYPFLRNPITYFNR